jgi:hypothetical protein
MAAVLRISGFWRKEESSIYFMQRADQPTVGNEPRINPIWVGPNEYCICSHGLDGRFWRTVEHYFGCSWRVGYLVVLAILQRNEGDRNQGNCLACKIETQTQALQKLSAKWLDRLTDYITTPRANPLDESVPHLVDALMQLPQTILMHVRKPEPDRTKDELIEELLICYICIYYYSALTNYWAQLQLPSASEFRPNEAFHMLVARVLDGSNADFNHIAKVLGQVDQHRLTKVSNINILNETRDLWRHHVRSTNELYAARNDEAQTDAS